jgi:peptide subunit release factor 1 (eRF1)
MADTAASTYLDKLAGIEAGPAPVLSLYLNTEVDGTGRHTYEAFVRKELHERVATYPPRSSDRESLARDVERVQGYLADQLQPSTRGLAVFACHQADLFEAVQLKVPFDRHQVVIADRPHLSPLARVNDRNPRYAALIVDTHAARIFVFGAGHTEETLEVQSPKTKHVKAGGWSQARIQRHVDHARLLHAKAVIERLDALVAAEAIDHVVLAGDEVIIPTLEQQLPERLAGKLVDILRLDIRSPEHEVLTATLDAIRKNDDETDEAVVRTLLDDYHAGGLAVAGDDRTRKALQNGQVDTLVITATPEHVKGGDGAADELVALAMRTSASVRFIEDPALLRAVDGVGARLRYRV